MITCSAPGFSAVVVHQDDGALLLVSNREGLFLEKVFPAPDDAWKFARQEGYTTVYKMDCGFKIFGVPLKTRLAHYRACANPECQARAVSFEDLKSKFLKEAVRNG